MSSIEREQEGDPLPFTLNLQLGFYTQFKCGVEPLFGVLSALHTVMELCPRLATRFLCRGLCLATRFLCRGLCLSECKRQHWTCSLYGFPHQQSPMKLPVMVECWNGTETDGRVLLSADHDRIHRLPAVQPMAVLRGGFRSF